MHFSLLVLSSLLGILSASVEPTKLSYLSPSFAFEKTTEVKEEVCYSILADAGSSGTRPKIYVFDCLNLQDFPDYLEFNEVLTTKKMEPLSDFAVDIALIANYLDPIIDFAKEHIPEPKWATTPLMLFATAGMRNLKKESQEAVMDEVFDVFSKSEFLVKKEWVRVISGDEEGIFLWISMNYMFDTISKKPSDTLFTLDMGGASAQITGVFDQSMGIPSQDTYTLEFNHGITFDVYTKSYLGLGNDMARYSVVDQFIDENAIDSGKISCPCFPDGLSEEYAGDPNYTLEGTGDFEGCLNAIGQFLDSYFANPEHEEPFDISEASAYGVAVSTYAYVSSFFQIPQNGSELVVKDFYTASQKYCSKTWDQILKEYGTNNPFLGIYCFQGSFVYEFMSAKGLGLKDDQVIQTYSFVGPVPADWSIGALMYDLLNGVGLLKGLSLSLGLLLWLALGN